MRIDELEELLAELDREGRRPKFIYSVPTFQNPGGVTLSLERRRRLVEIAREREILVVEDNPYGLLRFEGERAAAALLARRRRLRPLRRHALEDPLPRDPDRLGLRAAAGDGEARARQGRRRPLHLDPEPVLRPRVLRRGPLARLRRRALADLPRPPRRDARRARRATSRGRRRWSEPEGGLFVWATMPDYIDTTDLLAKALRENVAFVPGEAAFADGRGHGLDAAQLLRADRGRDPRGDPPDRLRDRRAGEPVRDDDGRAQSHPADPPLRVRRRRTRTRSGGDVLPFHRRPGPER